MSLHEHLTQQRDRLRQLEELLLEEQRNLLAAEVDGRALQQLAADKQLLLAAIEGGETRHRSFTGQAPYREGARLASAREDHPELWFEVEALSRSAARHNARNGELIALRLEQNQRLLNVLHDARGNHLYGPDGQARATGGQLDSRA